MMNYIIPIGIGVLSLSVLFVLAPVVGGMFEANAAIPAGSQWNQSVNADLKSGSDVWENLSPFLVIPRTD